MEVIELTESFSEAIKPLFFKEKQFMGLNVETNYFVPTDDESFQEKYYKSFCETYLSGLKNYKSLAVIEDNEIKSIIAFYMSPDEPAWYGTLIRSLHNKKYVQTALDAAIKYNEERNRFKFYTLWSERHSKLLRKFAFSKDTKDRYDYFDECLVPLKTKCFYTNFWHILFNRTTLPTDTVVRCTYLKNEYRKNIVIGGGL